MLASHTVVIASGTAAMPTRAARASMTGVSSTAVVSRFSVIVVSEANSTHRPKSSG